MLESKIKEPTEDDLNLAGEIVRAKLKIQNRSFVDDDYLLILIEETLKQIAVSKATISICEAVIF